MNESLDRVLKALFEVANTRGVIARELDEMGINAWKCAENVAKVVLSPAEMADQEIYADEIAKTTWGAFTVRSTAGSRTRVGYVSDWLLRREEFFRSRGEQDRSLSPMVRATSELGQRGQTHVWLNATQEAIDCAYERLLLEAGDSRIRFPAKFREIQHAVATELAVAKGTSAAKQSADSMAFPKLFEDRFVTLQFAWAHSWRSGNAAVDFPVLCGLALEVNYSNHELSGTSKIPLATLRTGMNYYDACTSRETLDACLNGNVVLARLISKRFLAALQ